MASIHNAPRVLVVEDNQDTRELLAYALERDGYRVSEADSFAGGLRALREGVDLVISDFWLGDGDGLEMVARARQEGLLAGKPVIVWTAHHNLRAPEPILVLQKPLGTDDLLAAVRRLLSEGDVPSGPRSGVRGADRGAAPQRS
ncbi:MAG TPA: response regulator [Polyangiaceae bacterium]|jgi:DNA-binding response OmpR family regulator